MIAKVKLVEGTSQDHILSILVKPRCILACSWCEFSNGRKIADFDGCQEMRRRFIQIREKTQVCGDVEVFRREFAKTHQKKEIEKNDNGKRK